MDIEEARRRSHEPTVVLPEIGLGWPGCTLRWTGTACWAASIDCPDGARREVPAILSHITRSLRRCHQSLRLSSDFWSCLVAAVISS